MHCFLVAEFSLPSIYPWLFQMVLVIWHFIFRLDFHGWDSIIKPVRSIRMNMVFLQLFQTYRFPKMQQGTGNQGVLCVTVHLLSPSPQPMESIFFQGIPSFCINYYPYFVPQNMSFSRSFSLLLADRRKPFYMMALKCLLETLLKSI